MPSSRCKVYTFALVTAFGAGVNAGEAPPPHYIAGAVTGARAPDGASVIFEAENGLVVVDTGRHPDHQQKILDFARMRAKPVVAIVNTHWHLDHTGGNAELRAAFPDLRIYGTNAVDDALEGFLANGRAYNAAALEDPKTPEHQKADLRLDLDAVDNPQALRPDVVVNRKMSLPVKGRDLELNVADRATTAADIWVWDPATHTAVVGDLVTLPAPFFDTACADGWSQSLREIAAKPIEHVIPGHGAPMDANAFAIYVEAFERLVGCANDPAIADCPERWAREAGSLMSDAERAAATPYAQYYVDQVLRAPNAAQAFCSRTSG
jgi:glyoxylase-like metal-dependent hydrolase (beta-lactamase superfamily II)